MQCTSRILLAAAIALAATACSDSGTNSLTAPDAAPDLSRGSTLDANAGAVYVSTNSPTGNEVLVFARSTDGSLGAPEAFTTGGLGTGTGLGNQDAVVLSANNRHLFVVNAGSNELSLFAVMSDGLELLDRVGSGGIQPISVAVHRRLVYVLNAGGTGNIAGFRLGTGGRLHAIANSARPLSSPAAGSAQVSFSPDGDLLAVTEKATNVISTYVVGADGLASGPNVQPSVGATPFGFAFSPHGVLVVSEAFGGTASALSSYRTLSGGSLSVISPSVGAGDELAACWVVITRNGRFAYTSNTGSNTISGYGLSREGELSLLDANAVTATTTPGPIDLALTTNSHFLYSLGSGSGTIEGFRVGSDGGLTPVPGAAGLPAGANGLAAR